MGRPKLLLPCGETTVLECVIAAVRAAGVEQIVVVTGPNAVELSRLATAVGADVLPLPAETPDMRATCQFGLAYIEACYEPDANDCWLLLPADHPTVRSEVISALLCARQARSEMTIFVPTFRGRRGHPTLLSWSHVCGISALSGDQGVNAYIRQNAATTMEVDWPSDEILCDLDTPEDYARLRAGKGSETGCDVRETASDEPASA